MSHNTWIHRAVRPGAALLKDTPITPNQITWFRLGLGFASAVLLADGRPEFLDWGAGVFLLGFFLDRLDGELARASGKKSAFGHKLDLVSDTICNALAFIGLGVGLMAGPWGGWALVLGIAAGLAIAAILTLVMHLESLGGERAGELGSAVGFDADDGMLAFPLLIWLGQADGLLMAAAIGAPAFGFFMAVKFRRTAARSRA